MDVNININQHTGFVFSKPKNTFLKSIVDSYFYTNIKIDDLALRTEYIIPFPRVTFGYFFNNPFKVINFSKNEVRIENSLISRVTKDQIVVEPTTDKIKILGAHLRPFSLAYFTNIPVNQLDWSVTPFYLLDIKAKKFEERLNKLTDLSSIFDLVEKSFLDALLLKDIPIIRKAVNLIKNSRTLLTVAELSSHLHVTERTLRNHFYKFLGCSPKEYLQIVRMKRATYHIYRSKGSLTDTGYNTDFYDQAHFINSFRNGIGKTPKDIRGDIPKFRFLQF